MEHYIIQLPSYLDATLEISIKASTYDGWCRNMRPMMIIIPGGGYAFCSDREAEPIADTYFGLGFDTCILRYSVRLSPEDPGLGDLPLLEAAETVHYVREHAEEWGVNPDRITVMGFSAGGHLAASLAAHWNNRERLPIAGETIKPNGLILAYPVITAGEKTHRKSIQNLTGIDGFSEEDGRFHIPSFVGADMPPAFIWHTFEDKSVPVENSLELASAMRKANRPFALHIFPNGSHGLSLATDEVGGGPEDVRKWVELSVDWLRATGLI